MLRMSWRYAPWSTRLVRFQKPVTIHQKSLKSKVAHDFFFWCGSL
jgi:hypothetical protein